jgi:hypothetical protein
MLVHVDKVLRAERGEKVLEEIREALANSARETDLLGWYQDASAVGVICTEIGQGDLTSILSALHSRVEAALQSRLTPEEFSTIHISFHVFPDDMASWKGGRTMRPRFQVISESHS